MQNMETKFIYMHLNYVLPSLMTSEIHQRWPIAHDLDTYIFTFTIIGLLSPQFSVQRPAFLKAVFQCESFDVGLIRVGESPEVRVMVLSRLIHLFRTHINHCAPILCNTFHHHLCQKSII